jgi:hypothetical protein
MPSLLQDDGLNFEKAFDTRIDPLKFTHHCTGGHPTKPTSSRR